MRINRLMQATRLVHPSRVRSGNAHPPPFDLSDNDRERRACEQAGAGLPPREPHQARSIARRAQERPGVQACTKDEEEGRGGRGGERRGLQEAQEAQGIGGDSVAWYGEIHVLPRDQGWVGGCLLRVSCKARSSHTMTGFTLGRHGRRGVIRAPRVCVS